MQGLQKNLIDRSKKVVGDFVLNVSDINSNQTEELESKLGSEKLQFHSEYEIEVLAKRQNYIAPVVLRGIKDFQDNPPEFLAKSDRSAIVLGADLSNKLQVSTFSEISFFSPAHTDEVFGDIPRMSADEISDIILTNNFEIDSVTAWVRVEFVQNLTRQLKINTIRIYSKVDREKVLNILNGLGLQNDVYLKSWEQMNPELLWAFQLESLVIISLFVCMCFLVSITIVAGNLIFFNKIKLDLLGFWILGLSKKSINRMIFVYFQLKTTVTCFLGIAVGAVILLFLQKFAPEIMPDVFLERSLPIDMRFQHAVIAFTVPYFVSSFFTLYALIYFKKNHSSYIELLRRVGD